METPWSRQDPWKWEYCGPGPWDFPSAASWRWAEYAHDDFDAYLDYDWEDFVVEGYAAEEQRVQCGWCFVVGPHAGNATRAHGGWWLERSLPTRWKWYCRACWELWNDHLTAEWLWQLEWEADRTGRVEVPRRIPQAPY